MSSSSAPTSTTVHSGTDTASAAAPDFISNILTPGSSLHPTLLLALDGAFALLLCVFLGLLFLTGGNIHICMLILIEGCLWASVKWFVMELQKTAPLASEGTTKSKEKEE